jgi:hypothetical protein
MPIKRISWMTGSSPVMTILTVHPGSGVIGGAFLQGVEPAMEERRMAGKVLVDFFANVLAIHVNSKIALLTESDCGPGILV